MAATALHVARGSGRSSAATQNDPSALKILLVEDDAAILEELTEVIELEGWKPVAVQGVDTALELLYNDPNIRVVVTDVHFKDESGNGANGIQLVSRARARFADRAISYIVLSGDPDAVIPSEQEGAFKFLPKPLVPDNLIATIISAVSRGDGAQGDGSNSAA